MSPQQSRQRTKDDDSISRVFLPFCAAVGGAMAGAGWLFSPKTTDFRQLSRACIRPPLPWRYVRMLTDARSSRRSRPISPTSSCKSEAMRSYLSGRGPAKKESTVRMLEHAHAQNGRARCCMRARVCGCVCLSVCVSVCQCLCVVL